MKHLISFIITLSVVLASCGGNPWKDKSQVTVYLQPYDFGRKEVEMLQKDLEEKFNPMVKTRITYVVLPNKHLTNELLNAKGTRYAARKILDWQETSDGVIIGLTHKDIAAAVHGVDDYGIMGLSLCPGNTCVVSDKRVHDKRNLWKVVSHEFMHAFYACPHCPNDDPACLMKDAKGKGNLPVQKYLCKTCKAYIDGE